MNEMTDDAVFERAAKLLDDLQTEKVSAYDTARILTVAVAGMCASNARGIVEAMASFVQASTAIAVMMQSSSRAIKRETWS